ncbi:hypothetical protein Tco_0847913 [Tanacetum coccineum]
MLVLTYDVGTFHLQIPQLSFELLNLGPRAILVSHLLFQSTSKKSTSGTLNLVFHRAVAYTEHSFHFLKQLSQFDSSFRALEIQRLALHEVWLWWWLFLGLYLISLGGGVEVWRKLVKEGAGGGGLGAGVDGDRGGAVWGEGYGGEGGGGLVGWVGVGGGVGIGGAIVGGGGWRMKGWGAGMGRMGVAGAESWGRMGGGWSGLGWALEEGWGGVWGESA